MESNFVTPGVGASGEEDNCLVSIRFRLGVDGIASSARGTAMSSPFAALLRFLLPFAVVCTPSVEGVGTVLKPFGAVTVLRREDLLVAMLRKTDPRISGRRKMKTDGIYAGRRTVWRTSKIAAACSLQTSWCEEVVTEN
jgi:hypothetical protein